MNPAACLAINQLQSVFVSVSILSGVVMFCGLFYAMYVDGGGARHRWAERGLLVAFVLLCVSSTFASLIPTCQDIQRAYKCEVKR